MNDAQEIDPTQSIDESMLVLFSRRSAYLSHCVKRFGFSGIGWWYKTYKQQDNLNKAILELRSELVDQNTFVIIEQTFSQFLLPKEDQGHVEWYVAAHNKLKALQQSINDEGSIDIEQLRDVISELKYISGADEFHEIYRLQAIQQKVSLMYQQLQQVLADQQLIEKQKIELEKQKQKSELARAEADKVEAEAKVKMMDSVKIKEKRLAIIEDKKCKQAEREISEYKLKEQKELAEIAAKEAESRRQQELQKSYHELELKESANELPLEKLVEVVKRKIENKKILTFIQLDQLSKLKQTIETKKI
ncbi:MAG: hypothetical protein Q9M92_04670 [Enterobacterales bacterium]|nr:hypothetical protein [Enterobacterales bacterium]